MYMFKYLFFNMRFFSFEHEKKVLMILELKCDDDYLISI